MNRLTKRLAAVSTLAVLVVLTAGAGSSSAQKIPNCVIAQNVEGIIDDSGSMAINDPNNFRADLMEALAFFNQGKTMGVTTFGTDAQVLFGPFAVGPNFNAIKAALATINSNAGGTDYDAAFSVANASNPSASARIFLSDGEPNFAPNPDLWRSPPTKAYVVGFGSADFAVLNQIAADTGGPAPFSIENSSQLRTVAQVLNARLNCDPDPILVTRTFGKQGQVRGLGFKPDGNSAQVLISWPNVGNVFKAISFQQGGGAGKSATLASIAKKRKGAVKVKSTRGDSYIALNLSKLKPGKKLSFKLRAKRLSGSETVTAAIIR
jgi:hypothetical protein